MGIIFRKDFTCLVGRTGRIIRTPHGLLKFGLEKKKLLPISLNLTQFIISEFKFDSTRSRADLVRCKRKVT